MEENKEISKVVSRGKKILNLAMIVLFIVTIALLLYMISIYLPLKEECLKCICNNSNVNLTDYIKLYEQENPRASRSKFRWSKCGNLGNDGNVFTSLLPNENNLN